MLSRCFCNCYQARFPGNQALQAQLDDWVAEHEAAAERKRKAAEEAADDGWTVVKRQKVWAYFAACLRFEFSEVGSVRDCCVIQRILTGDVLRLLPARDRAGKRQQTARASLWAASRQQRQQRRAPA